METLKLCIFRNRGISTKINYACHGEPPLSRLKESFKFDCVVGYITTRQVHVKLSWNHKQEILIFSLSKLHTITTMCKLPVYTRFLT